MQTLRNRIALTLSAGTAVFLGVALVVGAQASPDLFQSADPNRDGKISRDEMKAALTGWLGGRPQATPEQLTAALNQAFPESTFMGLISPPQNRTPKPGDVEKMTAALPATAPAKARKPRKILVLNKCGGFVHSCIPLAAKMMEELGAKTNAWTATVSYDSSVITADNLKQYDLVFLNNTTGAFLDDADPQVTAARKQALLNFVRSGKGLAGIHAASDSYHVSTEGPAFGAMLSSGVLTAADKNQDKLVDAPELQALAASWFDRIDTTQSGSIGVADFKAAFPKIMFSLRGPRGGGPRPPAARPGPDPQTGTWPDFNKLIGGFFKYHWNDPQHIVYKIDDPASPINAALRAGFELDDETYTFGIRSWSRENVHVLTSIDYTKMSEADKLKEDYPRADHDYGLSWIRREGKGRVFYTAHGHAERVYANPRLLQHVLAGVQYALGDLKANDAPNGGKRN